MGMVGHITWTLNASDTQFNFFQDYNTRIQKFLKQKPSEHCFNLKVQCALAATLIVSVQIFHLLLTMIWLARFSRCIIHVYLHEFEENNCTKIFVKCFESVQFIPHKLYLASFTKFLYNKIETSDKGSFDYKLQGTSASKLSNFVHRFQLSQFSRYGCCLMKRLWEPTISNRYKKENWEYWAQINGSYTVSWQLGLAKRDRESPISPL